MFNVLLLFLTVIVLSIYLYNQHISLEYFMQNTNTNNSVPSNILSMPIGDIHFIIDNSSSLIESSLLNYKLITNNLTNNNNNNNDLSNNEFITTSENNTIYISIFHHKSLDNGIGSTYTALGQYIHVSKTPIVVNDLFKLNLSKSKKSLNILTSSNILPIGYSLLWSSDINEDGNIFTIWRPYSPNGYECLGDIIVLGTSPPPLDYTRCLPKLMLEASPLSNGIIWHAINDMNNHCYCWDATNINLFRASNKYNDSMIDLVTVYNLPDIYLKNNILLDKTKESNDISKGFHI